MQNQSQRCRDDQDTDDNNELTNARHGRSYKELIRTTHLLQHKQVIEINIPLTYINRCKIYIQNSPILEVFPVFSPDNNRLFTLFCENQNVLSFLVILRE